MISEIDQEMTDFDWFGVDEDGILGHFTTAGFKRLPKSVAIDADDLKKVTDYFQSLEAIKEGHAVSADLERYAGVFKTSKERARYLASFSAMANRGLYSFDIDTYVRPGLIYFCVAIPLQPLKLNSLPPEIGAIVSRTVLRGIRLRDTGEIDYLQTLDF